MANHNIASAVRLALLTAAAAGAATYGASAAAQEQLQEITVTGSRIIRQDYEAASPVVSLSAEVFRQTGVINAERLVNTLPQVAPSFSTGNNNPGSGQAYINLRGLGEERNLVLVDGKRMVPGSEDALIDINTIPTSMIERIEVISGGASAVYGSDAIAGATNFILKRNFNGIQIEGQYGISEEGDTDEVAFNVTMGSDLADGRGNVVLYGSFNDRERLSKGDRAFSAQAVSTTSFFPSGHLRLAAGNNWTLAAEQDVFTNLYGAAAPSVVGTMVFNDDGTMFTQGNAGEGVINFRTVKGEDINGPSVAQNFIDGGDGFYSYNFEPWNNLILPQQRMSIGAFGTFAVTEKVEAYSRIMFTNYGSTTQLAPSPAPTGANNTVGGVAGSFTIPVTNPWVQANPGVLALANSRTGDNAGLLGSGANEDLLYRYRFDTVGPRAETYERDLYQFVLGLRGDLSENWKFDVYGGHGKFNEQLDQSGNVSVPKVENLLDDPLGGESFCEGGFDPFGYGGLSEACADYVAVLAKNSAQIEHNMAEAVLSGDLFSMPAGAVTTAVGAFWQEMKYRSLKDEILRSGDVSGFNAEDNITGRVANSDLFVELYVPLIADLPAVQSLGLTAGYRYSDHSSAGGNSSYKAELDWRLNDSFRVRGGYQRAVRAPNIAELFSPQNEDNPEVEDPCNFDSGERTGPNAARVEQLCLDQGFTPATLANYKQSTDQIDALAGGNPELAEETADTYTLGFVWQPDFADRLSISVDYFNIKVTDSIAAIDPGVVVSRCFNGDGANPTYDNNNFYCQLFGRFISTLEIKDLLEVENNLGGLKTDGVDLQVDWGFGVGRFGNIGLNFVATFVNSWQQQELADDPWLEYAGTIGEDVGETLPDWKASFTTVWDIASFSTALRIRFLPSMDHAESVISGSTDPDVCGCTGVGSTTYVDLSTRWQPTEALSVRLGIENLMNEDPQLYAPEVDSGTDPSTYDVIGRRYFLNATYKF
jgi:outer membrane receptor protein involved in Fe transport